MNWLERIAYDLKAAAAALDEHASEDLQYGIWASHFRGDAKGMQLKALVYEGEETPG